MRTASALTSCRARPGGEDGEPWPREPWQRSHWLSAGSQGPTQSPLWPREDTGLVLQSALLSHTALSPRGYWETVPFTPGGWAGLGEGRVVLSSRCESVHRPFAGKLRSPFLQRQLPQPESPLSGERAHAASRSSAGKALAHPGGGLGGDGVSSPSPVRAGCTALAGVCEQPAPSAPACPVQAEEEAVYEEPPEQETLYEEPPMVGSLQLGQGCEGLGPETASPATPGGLTALFKCGATCAISRVACAGTWEALGGEHVGEPGP